MVEMNARSFKRVIMNVLGNALQLTSTGFVALSLRNLKHSDSGKLWILLRISDSGKGFSDNFQHDRLFIAFSQEDPF